MGRLAKILSFVRVSKNGKNYSDVKVDTGGDANVTAQHFSPPGDDSHPLKDDCAAIINDMGTGRKNSIGYIDTKNQPKAGEGEKRIYARDSSGVSIAEIWVKNTGEITIENSSASMTLKPNGSIKGDNGSGSFELAPSGDFLVNNVTIKPNGDITTPGNITAVNITGSTISGTSISSSGTIEAETITATGSVISPSVVAGGKELAGHSHAAGLIVDLDTGGNK